MSRSVRILAVLAPILMLAAALPTHVDAQGSGLLVFYERPDQSLTEMRQNPVGWAKTWDVGYPVGTDGSDGLMTLTVQNGGPVIEKLSFRVPRINGDPDDPDNTYIRFLQGTSKAIGWKTTTVNTTSDDLLSFTYESGSTATQLAGGSTWKFDVGYEVHVEDQIELQDDRPLQFRVEMQGEYSNGALAPLYVFNLTVDPRAPHLATDNGGEDDPVPILTRDLDGNGRLDQILVTFDDLLDTRTFTLDHFRIDAQEPVQADYDWFAPGQDIVPTEPVFGKCPDLDAVDDRPHWGCTQVLFTIKEGQDYDTGDTPFLAHNPVGEAFADMAGNPVPTLSNVASDGAAPVLVSAQARTINSATASLEAVLLAFSEGVQVDGRAIEAIDISYTDTQGTGGTQREPDSNNPGTFLDFPDVEGVEHANGQYVNLVFVTSGGQGSAPALTSQDAPSVPPEEAISDGSADTVACRVVQGSVAIVDKSFHKIPCRTTGALRVPVLSLTVVEAGTDISSPQAGSQEVRLRFNGPVEAVGGGRITLSLGAFDIVGTQSGTVVAVTDVTHKACTDTVVLTVISRVSATDVDDTPAKVGVDAGKVQACSQTPGTTPVHAVTISPSPIPLVDTTEPRIIGAKTVDLDANGAIDGLELTFSEPVRDISFCAGSNPCPVGGAIRLHARDPSTAGFYDLADYGPFSFDTRSLVQVQNGQTGVGKDDDKGMIRWPQNDPDLVAGNALLSGYVPDLETDVGLFEDLAPKEQPSNLMERLTREEVFETDGAAPVLLKAETMDSDTEIRVNATAEPLPGCIFNEAEADIPNKCRLAPDGYLDGYMLTFSEPVVDASLNMAEWAVIGYRMDASKPIRPSLRADDGKDDERLFLPFHERREMEGVVIHGDTGEVPHVHYQTLSANAGLRDSSGNRMNPNLDSTVLDIGPDDIEEMDGAAPVLVNATGFIGQSWVRVHFSEPVDDGQDGALVRSDFRWQNIFSGGAGGPTVSPQVEHEADTRTAKVYLNAPLALGDIGIDGISAVADEQNGIGSIYETSEKVEDRSFVQTRFVRIQNATDLTPPGNVTELNVTFFDADKIFLVWRAPGEDGNDTAGPKVNHYSIKVSTEHIASFGGGPEKIIVPSQEAVLDAEAHDLPDDVEITAFEPWPLNPAGGEQRVQITGLAPDTKYHFAVVAVDEVGLVSPQAAVVTASTNIDLSPPTGGPLDPRVENKVNGKVTDLRLQMAWNELEDLQTKNIQYHFVLSQEEDLEVTKDAESTAGTSVTVTALERGVWYFHVRGFSGDSGGEADKVRIEIVAPPVDPEEAASYVYDRLNTQTDPRAVHVVRDGGINTINWTLPENPPGEIEALQFWRYDPILFEWILVGNVTGDYTSLRHGQFEDADGTLDSIYFVTPVYDGAQGFDPNDEQVVQTQGTPTSQANKIAWYWYLVGGLALALLAGAVVLVVVLRGRAEAAPPPDPDHQEGWSDVDEEGRLPVHEVDCPGCSTQFQATGHLPLPITCPECGVSGKLE